MKQDTQISMGVGVGLGTGSREGVQFRSEKGSGEVEITDLILMLPKWILDLESKHKINY